MKVSSAALLVISVGCAAANKPQFSIQVRDGRFNGIDALDPTVSWSSSAQSGDLDLDYGIVANLRPTSDLASLPRKFWGTARTDVSGWGCVVRVEMNAQNLKSADLTLDTSNEEHDLAFRVIANAGEEIFNLQRLEATKGFDQDGAHITVTPRFNLEDDSSDLVVSYSNNKTNVKLTASPDAQEVTFSQQIDKDNRIAPTITNLGDVSIEWERRLGDDNRLTTRLTPNDNVNVEWKDADWRANVNMPIDGMNINGANVSIMRDVKF